MRWPPRVAAALTISAVAVAALTWAGWPRPRAVVRIEADSAVGFVDTPYGPPASHRVIQDRDGTAFWFLSAEGALRGPWRPGRPMLPLGFDAAGRLLANSVGGEQCRALGRPDAGGNLLARHDAETGRGEAVVAVDGPAPADARVSRDLSTLALAATDPLTFDVYDVADGRKRARLTFPGRAGGLGHRQAAVAAFTWELSPDGRELLLAEAWNGLAMLTPQGVEVYEVSTGRLLRRLPHRGGPVPPALGGESADFGVGHIDFTGDGRGVGYFLYRRTFQAASGKWATTMPVGVHDCDYATGDFRPDGDPPSDHSYHRLSFPRAAYGGRTFWLRECWRDPDGGLTAYRVTGPAGATDWRPLPGEFGRHTSLGAWPQPGRPAVVYRYDRPAGVPRYPGLDWLPRRLARTTDVPTSEYLYHDWEAGEFRRVGLTSPGPQTHAVGPYDLAILISTAAGGTLTLWDLPPRSPWPWSVPAGVGLGVLLTAVGVRLRRRFGWPRRGGFASVPAPLPGAAAR